MFNSPKNTDKYYWTEHIKFKMNYYGLSGQRVLGVVRNPRRKEEGIVKNTIAVMKPVNSKKDNGEKWKQEIWVMYQRVKKSRMPKIKSGIFDSEGKQIRLISAWRYPGMSPKKNPIPPEILEELGKLGENLK